MPALKFNTCCLGPEFCYGHAFIKTDDLHRLMDMDAHMDEQCGNLCEGVDHPEVDTSVFVPIFKNNLNCLHLMGRCREEEEYLYSDFNMTGVPRNTFLCKLFWEQMKVLFAVKPVAGVAHRNFMTSFMLREGISETKVMLHVPEMYSGIFPLRLPEELEVEVEMEDLDIEKESEAFRPLKTGNPGLSRATEVKEDASVPRWPGMPVKLETPKTMTPMKHTTNAPARPKPVSFMDRCPRPPPLSEEHLNRTDAISRMLFASEEMGDYSPVFRPRGNSAETVVECTLNCSASCKSVGAGAGAGSASGAGSGVAPTSIPRPRSAFERYVPSTPPTRSGRKSLKGKKFEKVVLETPEHKLRREVKKEACSSPIKKEYPETPANSPPRAPKRKSEVELLKRREAFMPNGEEMLPAKRRNTRERNYTEPTEEELAAELEAMEEEEEFEDFEDAGPGAEWLLDFDESMRHLEDLKRAMQGELTMLEKRMLQREAASLRQHVRKLFK